MLVEVPERLLEISWEQKRRGFKEMLASKVKALYQTQEMSVVRKPTRLVSEAELPYLDT